MISTLLFLVSTLIYIPSGSQIAVINAGIGGNTSGDLIGRINEDVIQKEVNLVILMVGTNDMLNSRKMITAREFTNNLDSIIHILTNHKIELILVSPPPVDTTYLFERHDSELFEDTPNEKLDDISNIMQAMAEEYQLIFVDVFKYFQSKGIPKHNSDLVIRNEKNSGAKDGVHPSSYGYEIIAQQIFAKLKAKKKISSALRIVCFGDSITFGAHVAGEGTAHGQTYPAYLKSLIDKYLKND